jgi:hypothetical protein
MSFISGRILAAVLLVHKDLSSRAANELTVNMASRRVFRGIEDDAALRAKLACWRDELKHESQNDLWLTRTAIFL